MNLIPDNLLTSHIGTTFEVGTQNGVYYFRDFNIHQQPLLNTDEYMNLCPKINELTYSSVLIGGLGLGYIPYWILNNTNCQTVDILDNNSELISWTVSNNHLGSNANLIDGDVYSYTTSNTYDLILMDIWWGVDSENIDENEPILINRFKDNLTPGGSIYICLTGTIWTKE